MQTQPLLVLVGLSVRSKLYPGSSKLLMRNSKFLNLVPVRRDMAALGLTPSSQVYSESSLTSKMELLAKIVNG